MRRSVFIVRDLNFDSYDKYFDSLACAYQCAFSGSPWFEDGEWTSERVAEVLDNSMSQKGFLGKVLVDLKEEVVSFCWGYKIPKVKVGDVDFSKIYEGLPEEFRDAFWVCDSGVRRDFQKNGLVKILFRSLLESGESKVVSRTINPNLIRARSAVYGEPVSLGVDPVYSERKIFGWRK